VISIYSVIIVDDEKAVCEGLGVLIPWEAYGFEINGYAFDGKEAFEKIKSGQFDLIITDIKMPRLDGLELLRLIRERGHNEKVIVISSYNEFEYAKQAIKFGVKDYILKPVDEEILVSLVKSIHKEISEETASSQIINQSRQVLKSKLLLNLLEKGLDKDTFNRIERLNIEISGKFLYVCLIHTYVYIEQNMKDQLVELIDGIIKRYCCGYTFEANENRICILFSFSLSNIKYKNEIESEVFNELNLHFPGRVILALGGRARSISEVKYSYIQACKTLKWALFNEKYCIQSYEQINWENDIKNTPLVKEFENLKNALRISNVETIEEQAGKFFLNIQFANLSVELVYSIYLNLTYTLKKMIDEIGESSERILGNYLIKNMDKMTIKELQHSFTEACIDTIDFVKITRKQSGNRVINNVLEYMGTNYFKKLTLKDLSDKFHINHVYLGKLFYEVTGKRFSEYRNSIRVKQACRFLDTTDLTVYEVSERVGFKDINYFHRIFKENMGISPGKYRKEF